MLAEVLKTRRVAQWYADFDAAGVPSGPINNFAEVFADPQIVHREMLIHMPHPTIGETPQVANPVRFSAAPIQYQRPPPLLGEHTADVLRELLHMDEPGIDGLRQRKVIG
jgi:crotonobetainyl-CoA:carnitine CoA-transferase CaiB-like acyl-CoA transferase